MTTGNGNIRGRVDIDLDEHAPTLRLSVRMYTRTPHYVLGKRHSITICPSGLFSSPDLRFSQSVCLSVSRALSLFVYVCMCVYMCVFLPSRCAQVTVGACRVSMSVGSMS